MSAPPERPTTGRRLPEKARRIRRFVPRAARSLRRDLTEALGSCRYNVRAAWRASDPHAMERVWGALKTPEWEQAQRERRRQLQARRADFQDAGGRASYEGELRARPAARGLVLADIESRPDVETWLVDTIGLDDWHGDSRNVRLTVETVEPSSADS